MEVLGKDLIIPETSQKFLTKREMTIGDADGPASDTRLTKFSVPTTEYAFVPRLQSYRLKKDFEFG